MFAALALAACGGDDAPTAADDADDAADQGFFEPETADADAHDALLVIADLPGADWEITAQDDFGDDDDDSGIDFAAFAAREPACAELTALATLGGLFGSGDDEDDTVAEAQIEFSRSAPDSLPVTVEAEIEVKATVAEVQGAWGLVKGIMESDQTRECMTRAIDAALGEQEAFALLDFEFAADEARAEAPRDGAALAFRLGFSLGDLNVNARFEMYFWPLANAQVSLLFFGPEEDLERAFLAEVLERTDERTTRVAQR